MVCIVEIIAERSGVAVALQRKGYHVAPVGSSGEVQQADPGRSVGREYGIPGPDISQARMEKYPLFGFLKGFAEAVLDDRSSILYKCPQVP